MGRKLSSLATRLSHQCAVLIKSSDFALHQIWKLKRKEGGGGNLLPREVALFILFFCVLENLRRE